jgi:hypothetical protein
VYQLAGTLPFVALSSLPSSANQRASQRIAVRQAWHLMPPQNGADCAGRNTRLGTDPIRPAPLFPAPAAREPRARLTFALVSWPVPDGLDAADLEARLFTRTGEPARPRRPEPDWLDVHCANKRGKHVTLQLLWLEYKRDLADGWGYTQFCTHYRRWLARQEVVMRFEYSAGERMFVDFCGDTVPNRERPWPRSLPRIAWLATVAWPVTRSSGTAAAVPCA